MGRIGTLWVPMDRTCYNLNPRKKKINNQKQPR